jgi:hypothetical protein
MERKPEWIGVDMVGIIPIDSHTPALMAHINSVLVDGSALVTGYHQFTYGEKKRSYASSMNMVFARIFDSCKLAISHHDTYNLWICSPAKMIRFIQWIHTVLEPCLKSSPISFEEIVKLAGTITNESDPFSTVTIMLIEKIITSYFYIDSPETYQFAKGIDTITVDKEITAGTKQIKDDVNDLTRKKAHVLEVRRMIRDINVKKASTKVELEQFKTTLAALTSDWDTSKAEITRTKAEITRIKTEITRSTADLKRTTEELTRTNAEITRINADHSTLIKDVKEKQQLIEQLQLARSSMLAKKIEGQQKIKDLQNHRSIAKDDTLLAKYNERLAFHLNEFAVAPPITEKSVRIYILCHTEDRLKAAPAIYGMYPWASPILMKYQDTTFENAFWKQLFELRHDWYGCTMVGTLAFTANTKRNLQTIDKIIRDPSQWKSGYYHFWKTDLPITNKNHPHILQILQDSCALLNINMPTDNFCNYWMCSPEKMIRFLLWFEERARPIVMTHPMIMTNSKYKGSLTSEQLISLCGVPFYPHAPFVFERLFLGFFNKLIGG